MTETEKEEIQRNILKIANRVEEHGRESEIAKLNLNFTIKGQPAINYKVIKLFTPGITDSELVKLLFKIGIQDGAVLIKVLAAENGIRV